MKLLDPAVIAVIAAVAYALLTFIIIWYMRRQTAIQEKASTIQIFHTVVQLMEATREDRRLVREYIAQGNIQIPPPRDVGNAADRVCRAFDVLGFLDHAGLVNPRLVDMFYSVPFVLLYDSFHGRYVDYLRTPERRGPTHFWELVQFRHRVQNALRNHPAISGAADWQRNTRA